MLLAVAALGYAGCWIEGEVTESAETQKEIAKMLNVPADCIVVAFIPIEKNEKEGKRPGYKPFSERAWFHNERRD
jgi:nitroreductase